MRSLLVIGAAFVAFSASAADVPGGADLPMLQRPVHAEIVDYQQYPSIERLYPQGAVSRIGGKLRLEGDVQAEGQLIALTYELARGHDPINALNEARRALQKQSAISLAWCEGRDCGSSNVIANTIFNKSQLYGPDEQQAYLLLRLAPPRHETLLAFYAITRGNRKSYLHVEQLEADLPLGELIASPGTLLRQIQRDGELHLPVLANEPDNVWADLLSQCLNLDGGIKVIIGGSQAGKWQDALQARRIRATRLEQDANRDPGLYLKP
jgi:hypothetical protein